MKTTHKELDASDRETFAGIKGVKPWNGIERRSRTRKGILRRMQEKNTLNCNWCYPKLCTCANKNQHGVHKDDPPHTILRRQ